MNPAVTDRLPFPPDYFGERRFLISANVGVDLPSNSGRRLGDEPNLGVDIKEVDALQNHALSGSHVRYP